MKTFQTISDLAACVGQEVATSDWITVTQEHINLFAQATGDHQWIHVDVERAKKGPFGAPIAHGFLTLSLIPHLTSSIAPRDARAFEFLVMGVNYGLDKVRFPAPVPVNSKLRAERTLLEADLKAPNTIQLKQQITIEIEGEDKPALLAEWIFMHFA